MLKASSLSESDEYDRRESGVNGKTGKPVNLNPIAPCLPSPEYHNSPSKKQQNQGSSSSKVAKVANLI
jgi:hypothetical protein